MSYKFTDEEAFRIHTIKSEGPSFVVTYVQPHITAQFLPACEEAYVVACLQDAFSCSADDVSSWTSSRFTSASASAV